MPQGMTLEQMIKVMGGEQPAPEPVVEPEPVKPTRKKPAPPEPES